MSVKDLRELEGPGVSEGPNGYKVREVLTGPGRFGRFGRFGRYLRFGTFGRFGSSERFGRS